MGLKEAIKLVQNVLHEAPYSKDEVRLRLSHLLLVVIILFSLVLMNSLEIGKLINNDLSSPHSIWVLY